MSGEIWICASCGFVKAAAPSRRRRRWRSAHASIDCQSRVDQQLTATRPPASADATRSSEAISWLADTEIGPRGNELAGVSAAFATATEKAASGNAKTRSLFTLEGWRTGFEPA